MKGDQRSCNLSVVKRGIVEIKGGKSKVETEKRNNLFYCGCISVIIRNDISLKGIINAPLSRHRTFCFSVPGTDLNPSEHIETPVK